MPRHPIAIHTLSALLCVGAILAFAPVASSAVAQDNVNCNDARSTYEMNVCADRDYASADRRLNRVYERVMSGISGIEGDERFSRDKHRDALRSAQRAWIAYRDADCKGLVPMEWTGGTGTTAAVLGCMTAKTMARTKDLADRYGAK